MDRDQGSRSGEPNESGRQFAGVRRPASFAFDSSSESATNAHLSGYESLEHDTDSELVRLQREMAAVKARLMESKAALDRATNDLQRSEAARIAAASSQE